MYTVTIRDHIMIAHSLPSPVFGPAQRLHGATYVVDAAFSRPDLDVNHIVLDIGLAHEVLRAALAPLQYQNLDEMPTFAGKLTTTEYLAWWIHGQVAAQVQGQFAGTLTITLGESHVASAAYSAPV
ncbi:MAG: 6-carboxytetrahydropterin synthase [Bacteroidia bacterium]|jgi:6-pyruvoyl-tetrahydropterin synthase|nr:6-carboxytetrahydropterin synthase [Bacteroidia bacterium]